MEKNPPKTVRGCPCGGVIEDNHTRNPITLRNTFVSVLQLRLQADPKLAELVNVKTRTTGMGTE